MFRLLSSLYHKGKPHQVPPAYPTNPNQNPAYHHQAGFYPSAAPLGAYPSAAPPGAYPSAAPPGAYLSAAPPGAYPSTAPHSAYPSAAPSGAYPSAAPPGTYSSAAPPGDYPPTDQAGTYPVQGQQYVSGTPQPPVSITQVAVTSKGNSTLHGPCTRYIFTYHIGRCN